MFLVQGPRERFDSRKLQVPTFAEANNAAVDLARRAGLAIIRHAADFECRRILGMIGGKLRVGFDQHENFEVWPPMMHSPECAAVVVRRDWWRYYACFRDGWR